MAAGGVEVVGGTGQNSQIYDCFASERAPTNSSPINRWTGIDNLLRHDTYLSGNANMWRMAETLAVLKSQSRNRQTRISEAVRNVGTNVIILVRCS